MSFISMAGHTAVLFLFLSTLNLILTSAQLSNPITHDSHVLDADNKFLQRKAESGADSITLDEEEIRNSQCPVNLELKWQTEVASSIYATPVISDINDDGRAEIVVPSFVHYLEVLDGIDGEKHPGWPAFHKSSAHTSPVLADIDNDGMKDILMATYNGEILVFMHTGEEAGVKFSVPRLKVKKNWFEGLDPDHVDRKHPDIHASLEEETEGSGNGTVSEASHLPDQVLNLPGKDSNGTDPEGDKVPLIPDHLPEDFEGVDKGKAEAGSANGTSADCEGETCSKEHHVASNETLTGGQVLRVAEAVTNPGTVGGVNVSGLESGPGSLSSKLTAAQQELLQQWEGWHRELVSKNHTFSVDEMHKWDQFQAWKSTHGLMEGHRQVAGGRKLLQEEEKATVEENEAEKLDEEGVASWEVFDDDVAVEEDGTVPDEYQYDYDDYAKQEDMWADEDWTEAEHESEEDLVAVDSHILCTPVVADIDGDGTMEIIVAASYFFDREYYENPEHKDELPEGVDVGKYIAGAVVVFDADTQKVRWRVHLDLSTENTQFRAYIYSAPTVVDLDGDGRLEIVVGTSVGFIYCLHSDGTPMENFPIQMGEIQGQVAVADVNQDGLLELIGVDTKGNVAVFDSHGKELWERHTGFLIAQGATVGDVDGDSQLEVVVTTTGGHIWVLNGRTGENQGSFPFRTHGRLMAPALLVDLKPQRKTLGLHIAVVSFDGYLYVVDGRTGCADVVDIGETSYSMVLADQLDGGDDLELIVSTMNGNVFCFQTQAKYHPLKAWPSQNQGTNVAFSRQSKGVYFLPGSRTFRDVGTPAFTVQFEIVDSSSIARSAETRYDVVVSLLLPGDKVVVLEKTFDRPGVHSVLVKCPTHPTQAALRIDMFDQHKFHFFDEFSLSFHMHFYRVFKWVLALPLMLMLAALTLSRQRGPLEDASLPSFRQLRDAA